MWHTGLLVKISRVLPDGQLTWWLFLHNRRFRVHMGDQVSTWRNQSNGLPQGLSCRRPCLTGTKTTYRWVSRKFVYADNIFFALQGRSFSELESGLNSDTASISDYCVQWRLIPSVKETVFSVFHPDNKRVSKELNVYLNCCRINHNPCPVYLGVSLHRSLAFRQHATKTAAKIKSMNNIITKLATGTSWAANAQTLRSSAVALHCVVILLLNTVFIHGAVRSSHAKLVDRQLKETMRIIFTPISTPVSSSTIAHCSSSHQTYWSNCKVRP